MKATFDGRDFLLKILFFSCKKSTPQEDFWEERERETLSWQAVQKERESCFHLCGPSSLNVWGIGITCCIRSSGRKKTPDSWHQLLSLLQRRYVSLHLRFSSFAISCCCTHTEGKMSEDEGWIMRECLWERVSSKVRPWDRQSRGKREKCVCGRQIKARRRWFKQINGRQSSVSDSSQDEWRATRRRRLVWFSSFYLRRMRWDIQWRLLMFLVLFILLWNPLTSSSYIPRLYLPHPEHYRYIPSSLIRRKKATKFQVTHSRQEKERKTSKKRIGKKEYDPEGNRSKS